MVCFVDFSTSFNFELMIAPQINKLILCLHGFDTPDTHGVVSIYTYLAISRLKLYNLTCIIVYCEVKITLELFSPNFPDKLGIKNMFVLSFHLVCWKRSFGPISEFQTTALNQGTSTSKELDKTVNKKIKKSKLYL